MPQPTECPFGSRTWSDVGLVVRRKLLRKFPNTNPETLDDVLGEVMVDLVGYWSGLSSAHTPDPARNFRFAIQRGYWVAVRELVRFLRMRDQEYPASDFLHPQDEGSDYVYDSATQHSGFNINEFADPSPGPEELLIMAEEELAAVEMVNEMTASERASIVEDLLYGDETVSQRTRRRRRAKAKSKLRQAWRAKGL